MKTLILLMVLAASSAHASGARQSPVSQPVQPSFVRELQQIMKPKEMAACVLPNNPCQSEYDMCCSNGELCQATYPNCP